MTKKKVNKASKNGANKKKNTTVTVVQAAAATVAPEKVKHQGNC